MNIGFGKNKLGKIKFYDEYELKEDDILMILDNGNVYAPLKLGTLLLESFGKLSNNKIKSIDFVDYVINIPEYVEAPTTIESLIETFNIKYLQTKIGKNNLFNVLQEYFRFKQNKNGISKYIRIPLTKKQLTIRLEKSTDLKISDALITMLIQENLVENFYNNNVKITEYAIHLIKTHNQEQQKEQQKKLLSPNLQIKLNKIKKEYTDLGAQSLFTKLEIKEHSNIKKNNTKK